MHRQLDLFKDDTSAKRQTLVHDVTARKCAISRFNTRKTRPQDDIDEIAQSIERDGFELTSAPWAYSDNETYHVFAGGTRLLAAQQLDATIPIVLYEGYTEQEISRLSDKDNEQDGMHKPVPITDVWAEYARLNEKEGWTQQEIADAKCGGDQGKVSRRIKYHQLPQAVKTFMEQDCLQEGHLKEISPLWCAPYLDTWLTTEQAQLELAQWAAKGHTTRQTRDEVNRWKAFTEYADQAYKDFAETATLYDFAGDEPRPVDYHPREAFLSILADTEARSLTAVKNAERQVQVHIADNLEDYRDWVEARTAKEARKAIRARKEEALLANIVLGDAREEVASAPSNIRLVFTDPPYGVGFQSNRRVVTPQADVLEGDNAEAINLLRDVLTKLYPKMQDDSVLLCWSSWENYTEFKEAIADAGFSVKPRPIIWHKPNHSSGDLFGGYAPDTEPIIFATKGNPKLTHGRKRPTQTQNGDEFIDSEHPTKKPLDLTRELIKNHTNPNDKVVDPFAGSGVVVKASMQTGRKFWVCEKLEQWHTEACELALAEMDNMENIDV